ncbi:MAG: hypothetical protein QF921_08570 [Pseudomonadales bacterium]|nr:hypothetical protein [Pseudomonadales bacterium]MDP6470204.1 hypothetical protein [Pseudomonadales bacterium]MDP6827110.1 hypothetical protein [Pseudomonadales bacterium]MDP6971548.1 hypothetical protein [Pseudomonadales bacterium]
MIRIDDRSAASQGASLVAVLSALLLVVLIGGFLSSGSNPVDFMPGGDLTIERLLWLSVAMAVCVIVQLPLAYRAWAGSFWWLSRRLHYTLLLGANIAFVWWCWYWRLIPGVLNDVL